MPEGFEKVVHLAGSRFSGSYQRPQALATALCEKGFPSIYAIHMPIHRVYTSWRKIAHPPGLRLKSAWELPQPLACRFRILNLSLIHI